MRSHSLRVGCPGDYAPYGLLEGSEWSGIDISAMRSFCRDAGYTLDMMRVPWGDTIGHLEYGHIDMAVGGFDRNSERESRLLLTDSIRSDSKVLVGRDRIPRASDLGAYNDKSVTIAVNLGGTNEKMVRSLFPQATTIEFADNKGLFPSLLSGEADMILTDHSEAVQYADTLALSETIVGTETEKVYLVSPGNSDLLDQLNTWLSGHRPR